MKITKELATFLANEGVLTQFINNNATQRINPNRIIRQIDEGFAWDITPERERFWHFMDIKYRNDNSTPMATPTPTMVLRDLPFPTARLSTHMTGRICSENNLCSHISLEPELGNPRTPNNPNLFSTIILFFRNIFTT
jgi:hypothetical protein